MSIKKKLGLGVATAALGLSLIGGGTYAYFNDVKTVNNTFAAGELRLDVDPTIVFDVQNLKPGDYMIRTFEMKNDGTLDIDKVLMNTSFSGTSDFENHLRVDFLRNDGVTIPQLSGKTISDLQNIQETDITPAFWWWKDGGIPVGETDTIQVKVTFVDNGEDQNHLQGAQMNVQLELEAKQGKGVEK
ncbi:TasA family protein [Bacillus chungangensis]|uniref:Spore coat-associated protein N n=1 Tax=Bacillus chungangensis TaxID=587633 RepID=A0ABT9WQK7_9BACI|nr:TasA family protein [Bacillus chungangensis]MDQ0175065.1 spore coat-associated protein N [Bacillus chungangensis]